MRKRMAANDPMTISELYFVSQLQPRNPNVWSFSGYSGSLIWRFCVDPFRHSTFRPVDLRAVRRGERHLQMEAVPQIRFLDLVPLVKSSEPTWTIRAVRSKDIHDVKILNVT